MNNADVFRTGSAVAKPWATTTGYVFLAVLALALAQMASAELTNRYVIKDNAGAVPYDAWANAAGDIQTAINYAYAGETVLVAAATYDTGGITNWPAGTVLTNRVVINKAITVRSANNDPTNTIIKGAKDNGTNGPASVRCVYMTNGSALIGFTLTNGATLNLNYPATGTNLNHYGGGVWCQSTNTVISNCMITGNSASWYGGGAYYGTLYNCTLITNVAGIGGGAYCSYLYTCTLTSNAANANLDSNGSGGGGYQCNLYNCTLIGNWAAADSGGGTAGGIMVNCSLFNNKSAKYSGGTIWGTFYNCLFVGNLGGWAAGAAMYSTLYNCTIISNFSPYGGGTYNCILHNCTIVGNRATAADAAGGGVLNNSPSFDCIVNCIIYSNTAATGNGPNWSGITGITNSCTIGGTGQVDFVSNGNITNNSIFADWPAGNYRQSANSPGVNTGTNLSWMTTSADLRSKDLDGHSRIDRFSGRVDMGAYEYLPSGIIFRGW